MGERERASTIEARCHEAGWLPTAHDFALAIVDAAADPSMSSCTTVFVGSTEWLAGTGRCGRLTPR